MPQQPVRLEITNFGGLNIERGALVRPSNTFRLIENWDLVREGGIRKSRGLKLLGPLIPFVDSPQPLEHPIVAFRDYRRTPAEDGVLIAVDKAGVLYSLPLYDEFFIGGFPTLNLLDSGEVSESPFLAIVQGNYNNETIQYLIITLDSQDYPKKYDGTTVTKLGIDRPDKNWTIDSERSIIVRIIETTADEDLGIASNRGHKYRWRFYNPITKHFSSPAPLSDRTGKIRTYVGDTNDTLDELLGQALGVSFGPDSRYVREVRLSIDDPPGADGEQWNDPDVYLDWINNGYTKIRIERTRDGADEFYFLPRLYDRFGCLITDDEGNIDINTGRFQLFGNSESLDYESVSDGYVSLRNPNQSYDWTVNGGAQSGGVLKVKIDTTLDLSAGSQGVAKIIRISNDPTNYCITAAEFDAEISGTVDSWNLTIEPSLQQTPADGAEISFVDLLPVLDEELNPLNTVPPDHANDPPPKASWGAIYQNRLFLVDALDKTRLVFSEVADFQSFPPENVFNFLDEDLAPITAVLASKAIGLVSEGADTKLIVGKERSTAQIAGTGRPEIISSLGGVTTTDFDRRPLHAETGIVAKKAARVVEESLIALTRRGLETLEAQQPQFIGAIIRELTDTIEIEGGFGPSFAVDRKRGQIIAAVRLPDIELVDEGAPDNDQNRLILIRTPFLRGDQGGLISPFTVYTLPTDICCVYESGSGDNVRLLAGGANGLIYELFKDGIQTALIDSQYVDSPVEAVIETQELPVEEKEQRKIFRRVRFDGVDLDENWKISFSVDKGQTFTAEKQMRNDNLIGLTAKTIIIRIKHNGEIKESEELPFLSNMSLEMIPIGRAR